MIFKHHSFTRLVSENSSNEYGSRECYDPITLPSEVYLNKSVGSKVLSKLEVRGAFINK